MHSQYLFDDLLKRVLHRPLGRAELPFRLVHVLPQFVRVFTNCRDTAGVEVGADLKNVFPGVLSLVGLTDSKGGGEADHLTRGINDTGYGQSANRRTPRRPMITI